MRSIKIRVSRFLYKKLVGSDAIEFPGDARISDYSFRAIADDEIECSVEGRSMKSVRNFAKHLAKQAGHRFRYSSKRGHGYFVPLEDKPEYHFRPGV